MTGDFVLGIAVGQIVMLAAFLLGRWLAVRRAGRRVRLRAELWRAGRGAR